MVDAVTDSPHNEERLTTNDTKPTRKEAPPRDNDGDGDVAPELMRKVLRLHAGVLALVCGFLGGAGLSLMTAWLLVKGGPHVGDHLRLLGQYFYGYTVTWTGAVVGFFYGALVGAIVGWAIGVVYNAVAGLRE